MNRLKKVADGHIAFGFRGANDEPPIRQRGTETHVPLGHLALGNVSEPPEPEADPTIAAQRSRHSTYVPIPQVGETAGLGGLADVAIAMNKQRPMQI